MLHVQYNCRLELPSWIDSVLTENPGDVIANLNQYFFVLTTNLFSDFICCTLLFQLNALQQQPVHC